MRQIFSSPRLENVERLEQVLTEAGIDTKVSNRPTWNRATKRDFSYTERSSTAWPALWVVKADDYRRAREILKDCGLLESTRPGESSYLPPPAPEATRTPQHKANRARWVLVVVVAVVAALVALRMGRML